MSEPRFARQFSAFVGVGAVAAVVHYGSLVLLVEVAGAGAVPAALAGYSLGGVVSYVFNRRYAFMSDRPHREATWRFSVVMVAGFLLTWAFMGLLHERLGWPYIPAQVITTLIVMVFNFVVHRAWTFGEKPVA